MSCCWATISCASSKSSQSRGRTRRIIWQNFAGTIAVDTVGVALASVGFLNPLLAAFIHVASELVFILNSARLLSGPDHFVSTAPRPASVPHISTRLGPSRRNAAFRDQLGIAD